MSVYEYIIGAILINGKVGLERHLIFENMIVFSTYAIQIIMSFIALIMIFMSLPRDEETSFSIDSKASLRFKSIFFGFFGFFREIISLITELCFNLYLEYI